MNAILTLHQLATHNVLAREALIGFTSGQYKSFEDMLLHLSIALIGCNEGLKRQLIHAYEIMPEPPVRKAT